MQTIEIKDKKIRKDVQVVLETFAAFGVEMQLVEVIPAVTDLRIRLKPKNRVRMHKIREFADDLRYALGVKLVRIDAPLPETTLIGVSIPKDKIESHYLWKDAVRTDEYQKTKEVTAIPLGRDVFNKPLVVGLRSMPHLLIVGCAGSGKSILLHSVINSLITRNTPYHLRLILIEPKRVEFSLYANLPHLLTPCIQDAKKSVSALKWVTYEINRRYDVLETEGTRDISEYHQKIAAGALQNGFEDTKLMPYIVIVIDEIAGLMTTHPREIENLIIRLTQMGRAVGIHILVSTVCPTGGTVTGKMKANIPARIAFRAASQADSRMILGAAGAEQLLGSGDMLYLAGDTAQPIRGQACFITEKEIRANVGELAKKYSDFAEYPTPSYTSFPEEKPEDNLYEKAEKAVRKAGRASVSFIQRKLHIGYARSARLLDMLEERGVVGPADGSALRNVIE
jgi:S-DNA-T family DNA segregation ATPase FtsK/SpoIIIE